VQKSESKRERGRGREGERERESERRERERERVLKLLDSPVEGFAQELLARTQINILRKNAHRQLIDVIANI